MTCTHYLAPTSAVCIGLLFCAKAAAQLSTMSEAPNSKVPCESFKERCLVPVPVVIDSANKYGCRIDGATALVLVPRSTQGGAKKIRVVWEVNAGFLDELFYSFRFSQSAGIKFVPAEKPDETVYPPDDRDFDSPGWDDDASLTPDRNQRRFRWRSVNDHGSERAFHYQINVEWKWLLGQWKPCDPIDPKIVNTN